MLVTLPGALLVTHLIVLREWPLGVRLTVPAAILLFLVLVVTLGPPVHLWMGGRL